MYFDNICMPTQTYNRLAIGFCFWDLSAHWIMIQVYPSPTQCLKENSWESHIMNNSIYVNLYKNVEYKLSICVDNPKFQYPIVHRWAENKLTIISVNLIFDKLTRGSNFHPFSLSTLFFAKVIWMGTIQHTPCNVSYFIWIILFRSAK